MIADDHPLLRSGIAAVLARSPQVTVVAEAEDGDAAVALFQQHRPDITLMDLQMPGLGGIEAIAAIRAIDPQARIIILTTFSGDAQIYRGLKAGASGYLLKNMARAELLDYLVSVHEGDSRLPLEVTRSLPNVLTMEPLTPRETDVLKLVATGHSNQRAASQLGLKEDTIKAYMKSILAKLRARDRTHAVTIALKRGFWEA
ncbi:response regulator transcription factor [Duganella sp. sic0402]|nr:response regulator transcription factor [Duganella sp. sic0402]